MVGVLPVSQPDSFIQKRLMRRPLPMAAFCAHTGRSARTIRRHIAEPRAEYEARSISRATPWIAEGISRSTWYRRRRAASAAQAA